MSFWPVLNEQTSNLDKQIESPTLDQLTKITARLFVDIMRLLYTRHSEQAFRANADGLVYFPTDRDTPSQRAPRGDHAN